MTFPFFECTVGLGLVNYGGYAFNGFLIRAFVAEIGWKTTFPFFECTVGLGMVNYGGYAFCSFLIQAFVAKI